MNKFTHAFDPALGELYTQKSKGEIDSREAKAIDARQLFYQLNQSGNNQDVMPAAYAFLVQRIKALDFVGSPIELNDDIGEILSSLEAPKIAPLPERLLTKDKLNTSINQMAAIQLKQPCWLQNISQASFSQADIAVQLMSVYLQLVGTEHKGANGQQLFRALILASGHEMPVLHSYVYSQQSGVMSEVFDFAVIQLALARFPRVLLPEILGFTLAYCQTPTLLEVCFPNQQQALPFFKLHKQLAEQQLQPLRSCILSYLGLFSEQKQSLWQRIQKGFWLYHRQMQSSRDGLQKFLDKPQSTQQAVAQLLQQKAAVAMGHHQKIQLQEKTLDSWFAGLPANSNEFLLALKQSAYVNNENPADSRLLKLFEFKGPMYGVLDQPELEIIKNWLASSLNEKPVNTADIQKNTLISHIKLPTVSRQQQKKYATLSNRELYYYLVNADLFPEVLPVAQAKVHNRLRARALFNPLPFKHYSHQQFDTYIDTIYQQEISAYRPLQGKPKISREAYIWGLEQIAPMILIDGCWLQNSQVLQNINSDISDILFNIYCDEIGNGQLEKNHPYIFQQLLESLSIQIPPVHSEAFVKHPGFINSAFDLPVYMLALSSFSVKFFPELLGLNMAIELSGLGKGYMRLVDDWNYWGIDPGIANIHISIDNAASGHTFQAKKTIKLYMDDILQCTDDPAVLDRHWRRIYSGYTSLRFVGGRFKLGLPVWYLIYKFMGK